MIEQDLANVVRTNEENGFWTAQVEAFGFPDGGLVPVEILQPHGLCSVPSDAEMVSLSSRRREANPQKAARLWYGWQNDAAVGLLLHSLDTSRALPRLTKGGTVVYGGPRSALAFLRLDGDGTVLLSSGPAVAPLTLAIGAGAWEGKHPAGASVALRASGAELYGAQVRLGGEGGGSVVLTAQLVQILTKLCAALTAVAARTVPTSATDVAAIVVEIQVLMAQLGTVQTVAR